MRIGQLPTPPVTPPLTAKTVEELASKDKKEKREQVNFYLVGQTVGVISLASLYYWVGAMSPKNKKKGKKIANVLIPLVIASSTVLTFAGMKANKTA